MDRYRGEGAGVYRPSRAARVARSVPDAEFNEVFARLPSNRDRALVAFYVSTGARASELLSAVQGGVHPGRQVIAVTRKGTRRGPELPASAGAVVWVRLYQAGAGGLGPRGAREAPGWARRRPPRPPGHPP